MNNQENILMMDGNGIMKDSNGNVIAKFATLKSELLLSTPSIADLEKRIKALEKQITVISGKNFHINSNGDSFFTLTHGANVKNNKETEAMKVSLVIGNDGDTRVVSELNMSSKSTDTNLFLSKVYASLHELELHQQKSTPSADAILSHLSDELTARGF